MMQTLVTNPGKRFQTVNGARKRPRANTHIMARVETTAALIAALLVVLVGSADAGGLRAGVHAKYEDNFFDMAMANEASLAAAWRTPVLTRRFLSMTESQFEVARDAWARVENATYADGAGTVAYKTDRVQVSRSEDPLNDSGEYACWVLSEQTNDADDWAENFDFGFSSIKSIEEYDLQAGDCGCAWSLWGTCLSYNECEDGYKTIGIGYTGFVEAWNGLREDVWKTVNATCDMENDTLMIVGYSRGGALANLMAFSVYTEGLWDTDRIGLVTFGSPRVLLKKYSNDVHNQFYQLRLVYKSDPIPAVPTNTFGFVHYGEMHCYNCTYPESRDAPTDPNFAYTDGDIEDHTSYDQWLG